jgi:hypothetical protein
MALAYTQSNQIVILYQQGLPEAVEMEKYSDEVSILVAQTGPLNGQRYPLRKTALIGREPSCDIVIPDRQVSRHHARLLFGMDGIYLEDLGSKNGTHYNGQLIEAAGDSGAILLQDGDVIQIALAQKFLFLSSDATIPLEDQEAGRVLEPSVTEGTPLSEQTGRLHLEKRSRRVWIRMVGNNGISSEEEIVPPLSVSQFRLLEILFDQQGRVVSRQDLAARVWGEDEAFEVSEQALDALVRRLRDRIANIDPRHEYIITVRGHGLRLQNPPI